MASRFGIALAFAAALALPGLGWAKKQQANDDLAVTPAGQSVWINVLANDSSLGPGLRLQKVDKPAHGSAAIENGGVRYTPKAGFQGTDVFTYKVKPDKGQPGEAQITVAVGPNGFALRLVGRVVDDPIPFALVTVSIGGFDFQAAADANGNYTLDLAALHADAFVTLVAAGNAPSGKSIVFYSAVGEIQRLVQHAGGDGILVRDENNQVQITNLSTAQYSLLTQANGGDPPDNDEDLIQLLPAISLTRLLELAAVIELVTNHPELTPPGTPDALSLIADAGALATYEAALPPGRLDLAIAEVEADPAVAPGYHLGAMPRFPYIIVPVSAPGTIQPFEGVGRLLEMPGSFTHTSGAGWDHNIAFEPDPRMNWAVDGVGDIIVTPLIPYTRAGDTIATGPGCEGVIVLTEDTAISTRLHRLQDGDGLDYLEVTDSIHRHFIDGDGGDGCDAPADTNLDLSYLRMGFELFRGELSFDDNEAFGKIALSHWSAAEHRWATSLFDFTQSPGVVVGAGLTFTSEVDTGHLLVHLSDGSEYEYWRFQGDGRKGEGLLAVATLPPADGRSAVSYNLASRVDGSISGYAGVSIPGTWRSGAVMSQTPGETYDLIDFSLVLDDNVAQTGHQHQVDANGVNDRIGIDWHVEGNNLVVRGYADQSLPPGFRQVSACVSLIPADCWQSREREWVPLSRDGNRIYMIETVSFPETPHGPLVIPEVGQRVNFWELQ